LRPNKLRQLLKAGKPSLGTRLHNSWPSITEIVGYAKHFDYIEFLAEYAPYDLFGLDNVGRAINLFDHMCGLIKIEQESRMHLAVRAWSAGIQNFLFTDCRTPEEVRECIRCVRPETPEAGGLHGVGQGRDVGIVVEVGSKALVDALNDAVIILMIEKRQAIEDLPALLSVPGVDMVQFGPADYSMSIGAAGQRNHPAVREAQEYMIKTALQMGITPRAEINNPKDAEQYLALGVRHFCMGTDVRILYNWYTETGGAMREVMAKL
jgi:4-hydroxy-2-oxoheptanedioate aldolase